MTPNSDKPINSEEVRCKDCDDCARHAYSDATMPGFFYDKCEKHRKPINSVSPASAIEQLIYGYIEGSGKDNGFHLYAPLSEQVRMKVMLFLQGLYENKRLNDGLREIAKNLQIEMESINSVSPASTKEEKPDRRPINRPCSACSAGDVKMEYHLHQPPFRDTL